jgi:hypothetical protein
MKCGRREEGAVSGPHNRLPFVSRGGVIVSARGVVVYSGNSCGRGVKIPCGLFLSISKTVFHRKGNQTIGRFVGESEQFVYLPGGKHSPGVVRPTKLFSQRQICSGCRILE